MTEDTVTGNFVRPCLTCGATVRVVDSWEQAHDCQPPASGAELIARAWWNGHDNAAAEAERLRAQVADLRGRLFSIYAATAAALTSAAPSGEQRKEGQR